VKVESLREVRNNLSQVIDELPITGPVLVTRNGKASALLLPVDENRDLEALILSNSKRFWEIMDSAGQSGRLTSFEDLPDANDEKAWEKLNNDR
jgi:prevent-host-death family protein